MKTDWGKKLSPIMDLGLLGWIVLIGSVVALIYPASKLFSNPGDFFSVVKRCNTPTFSGVIKTSAKGLNNLYLLDSENFLLASLNQDNLFLTKEKMRLDELLSWVAIGTGGAAILTSLILTIFVTKTERQANSAYNDYLNSTTQSDMDRYYNDHKNYVYKYNGFLISTVVIGVIGISALVSGIIVLFRTRKRGNRANRYFIEKSIAGSLIQPLIQKRF